jgi:hypothetical protein
MVKTINASLGDKYISQENSIPLTTEPNREWIYVDDLTSVDGRTSKKVYEYRIHNWAEEPQEPIRLTDTWQGWQEEYRKVYGINQELLKDQSNKQEIIDNLQESNSNLRSAHHQADKDQSELHEHISELNEKVECLTKANRNQANTIDAMRERIERQRLDNNFLSAKNNYVLITESDHAVTAKLGRLSYDKTKYEVIASGDYKKIQELVKNLNEAVS